MTPISPELQSLAMLLFSKSSRGIQLIYSRPCTGCKNNDSNHFVVFNRQWQTNEDVDTHKNILFLSTGSIAVAQKEDGGWWMHEAMVAHKLQCISDNDWINKHSKRYVKATSILAEDNLRKEMSKSNRLHSDDQAQ